MVDVPTPTMTREAPFTAATFGLEEVNTHVPVELDVGGFKAIAGLPSVASIGANVPIVGIAPNTRMVICVDAEV